MKQLKRIKKYERKNVINPVVSIVCITFNHEMFIGEAIKGFLMQETSFPFDIIIHDDASTDSTPEIIKEFERLDSQSKIKAIYQKENQHSKGVEIWSEIVFPKARGKYIALCEGDDYWTDPFKLQKQVVYMEKNPHVILTYHEFENIIVDDMSDSFYEPVGIPLLRPRTLTLMFKNTLEDFPSGLTRAPNGDQALKFYLSTKGDFKPLYGIKPSVRRVHSGGIMSLKPKKTRLERGLKTWVVISKTYSGTKHSKKLKKKVKGFESSLKWLAFTRDRNLTSFKTAIIHDIKSGLLLRKIKKKLKLSAVFKLLVRRHGA